MPISESLIKEKVFRRSQLSVKMRLDDFVASNEWPHRWQQRYDIRSQALSGDRADIDAETVNNWSKSLPFLSVWGI